MWRMKQQTGQINIPINNENLFSLNFCVTRFIFGKWHWLLIFSSAIAIVFNGFFLNWKASVANDVSLNFFSSTFSSSSVSLSLFLVDFSIESIIRSQILRILISHVFHIPHHRANSFTKLKRISKVWQRKSTLSTIKFTFFFFVEIDLVLMYRKILRLKYLLVFYRCLLISL